MNVVRMESALRPRRGRRREGSRIPAKNQVSSVLPKYQFDSGFRHPLVNLGPTSTSSAMITPRNRRGRGRPRISSSSAFRSSTCTRTSTSINPGTSTSPNTSVANPCIVLAITTGRGDARNEVGMAAVDLQFPFMILCQISDSQTYVNTLTKIHMFQPVEILMPDTIAARVKESGKLYRTIKERFENINITAITRRHFSDTAGLDRIRTHCAKEYASVELFVKQKFYALAAAAALFKYVEYIQHVLYAPKSMRIEFQGSEHATMIDVESAQSLELVVPQSGPPSTCFLGALDRCSTPMGRQSCVAELVSNTSLLTIVQSVVKRLSGADRLLSLAMQNLQTDNVRNAERNLNYVLLLKNTLDILPELRTALQTAQADFFAKVRESLSDTRFQLMLERILEFIHPDARSVAGFTSSNMQRCFALKTGISDILDIARRVYCELIDDMKSQVDALAAKYSIPLALGCSASLGYHIQMEIPRGRRIQISDLPPEFIEVQKQRNFFYMTTETLLVLSLHCIDACEELHIMSNVLLNEMLTEIRQHIGCLYQLSADVAELDIVISFARISSIPDYIRPTFGPKLELKDSKHPIMDILGREAIVANDIESSVPYNFHTIIGPNMSGKSVYLKQIVLLHIMAQIGCYVPATKAQFRIANRIFCRIFFGDNMECNASTFVLEIREIQYILQTITPTSLVVMDELCRGTTAEEGTSIAWAVCEQLLRTTAFTFCTTHFLSLTRLSDLYCNAINHYFETLPSLTDGSENSPLIYTHKMKTGVKLIENYGIALAGLTGLPESVLAAARQCAALIAQRVKSVEEQPKESKPRAKRCYDFIAEIHKRMQEEELAQEQLRKLIETKLRIDIDGSLNTTEAREIGSCKNIGNTDENNSERDATAISLTAEVEVDPNPSSMYIEKRKARSKIETDKKEKIPRIEPSPKANENFLLSFRDQQNISFASRKKIPSKCNFKSLKAFTNRFPSIDTIGRESIAGDFISPAPVEDTGRPNFSESRETIILKTLEESNSDLVSPISVRSAFSSQGKEDAVSQTSTDTEIAKFNAREKEAAIFKIIEGDAFREDEFIKSQISDSISMPASLLDEGDNTMLTISNDDESNRCTLVSKHYSQLTMSTCSCTSTSDNAYSKATMDT